MVHPQDEDLGLRYLRVANKLRKGILEGLYQPGERLPPQHDLAKQHNVAFATLKQALDILEREGYVIRKVGQGTYASVPERYVPEALIVDDESHAREVVSRALAGSGWNCTAVSSGEEALQKVQQQRFDVVLLDLVMAGMNGSETFRQIRVVDPEVEVVIITAFADSTLMTEALRIGPFSIMKKPVVLEELRSVLRRLTSGRQSYQRIP